MTNEFRLRSYSYLENSNPQSCNEGTERAYLQDAIFSLYRWKKETAKINFS